ncbi:MAG: cytochrome P450 [Myxococcales bacterium]|nr:cytochrome P450 [Myxococcales bacterium]
MALARAHAEVDALGHDPTTADLPALPWVSAIVKEAMRLYPPAWAMGREAIAPISIRGHRIEPGQQIAVSPWILHHDPRWWIEPNAFRPERWTNGETEGLPRMAFLPFGGGPRVCIGNHFATMEAVLVLATLLRHRTVERTDAPDPRLLPAVTLRPRGGLPLRVCARP